MIKVLGKEVCYSRDDTPVNAFPINHACTRTDVHLPRGAVHQYCSAIKTKRVSGCSTRDRDIIVYVSAVII